MTIKVTYNVTDVYMSQSVSPVYINVSYSDGGASGGGVWGSITGTLSNQTDLQTALDAKLDESTIDGGTEGQILSKASGTDFDFAWINNYAKYLATNVRNQTGSTIGAFQVVYISGATGNKPLISLADADTEATSSKTYGVTATSIANNGTGDVVTAGELSGIDTSAFNEGDLLWLSTTAGGVVTSPPAEPAHAVFIGYVIRSHPTLGVIDVSIANGYELNELHGVQITTPTDNQGLFYNSTSTLWENKSITTALGYTPVPTTRNITINGVTYDLSADRTWTIAAGISGSGASGQVTYWTGASAVSGSNNLFWDNANGRLGIGTNAPANDFDLVKTSATAVIGRIRNLSADGYSTLTISNDLGQVANYSIFGSNYVTASLRNKVFLTSEATNGFGFSLYNNSATAHFSIFTTTSLTERFRLFGNTGNLVLQNGGTFTDGGQRLQVIGDTLLRGSGNTSATTALTVQNSSSQNIITIKNNRTSNIISDAGQLNIASSADGTNGLMEFDANSSNTQTVFVQLTRGTVGFASTAINQTAVRINGGFAPTSGTATWHSLHVNPSINQTGGANGITRGLYVNPTLTAAADWRSIEWSNNSGWGLYGAGTANNYLAGRLGLGSTALTFANFRVSNAVTGGVNATSIFTDSVIQSDVTNTGTGYYSGLQTAAASFTLANLRHFIAEAGTFGAGSVVTTQSGFTASSNLTGATNNYGFRGSISAATGRWNIYMDGTADNYLAGNLGIGITPTVRLQVSGDTILRGSGATSATTALTVQNSSSTNLFTVRNDGNVGIGTASPLKQLHIASSTGAEFYFQDTSAVASINITTLSNTAGNFAIVTRSSTGAYVFDNWGIVINSTTSSYQRWFTSGSERIRLKANGQLRFVPLASAPASPEAGDVYYDSTLNKLRVYTTAWETITSI